jgi:MFS family permease
MRARGFYGWWVVAGVFAMLVVSSGLGFYNLTVYLSALSDEQGFSVGVVSGATATFFVASGLAGIPVAANLERRDPRPLIAVAAVVGGIAIALIGQVGEVWQLYVVYAVFGAAFAGAGLVPGMTLVTRWFVRRRSVALSIASTGLSVGGIVVTPLSARLIDADGLGATTPWLGLAFVVGIVPVTAVLLRPSPAAIGLWPDGDPAPPPDRPAAPDGTAFDQAVRSRFFLAGTGGYVLVMLAQVGGIAHLFNLVGERADDDVAAAAVSLLAGTSIVARLVGGVVAARLSLRWVTATLIAGQSLALVALSQAEGETALLLAAAGFGVTVGNLLMLHPLVLAEAFGMRDYGRVYSVSQLVMTLGIAAGPLVVGAVHDLVDGYELALLLAAGASASGAATFVLAGPLPGRQTPPPRSSGDRRGTPAAALDR